MKMRDKIKIVRGMLTALEDLLENTNVDRDFVLDSVKMTKQALSDIIEK